MILCGDVLDTLGGMPDRAFDACLCDPPYGLRFMGRRWDHGVPSVEVWREVLRVLKPGAFLFAFGGTRTYHRLACAIEDAGFEIRDSIGVPGLAWIHGQGFPKSLDISKAIDKAAGAEREVLGRRVDGRYASGFSENAKAALGKRVKDETSGFAGEVGIITAPATPAAKLWQGYGTALKPAWEPVVVAMKPLDGTFAANALTHGVAGLNVDGGRVAGAVPQTGQGASSRIYGGGSGFAPNGYQASNPSPAGRWPPNLAMIHHPDCREVGTRRVAGSAPQGREMNWSDDASGYSGGFRAQGKLHDGYADADGLETVSAWECVDGCPVKALDEQAGERPSGGYPAIRPPGGIGTERHRGQVVEQRVDPNSGPASRFFYCAKVSSAERNLADPCDHPTMKPIELCKWLATLLLTPKRETPRRLLVPFAGVGSEMIGAVLAGWEAVVGIENDLRHCAIGRRRIGAATSSEFVLRQPVKLREVAGPLFEDLDP